MAGPAVLRLWLLGCASAFELSTEFGEGRRSLADKVRIEAEPAGCSTQCEVEGERASCASRIAWLASHVYGSHGDGSGSCARAHGAVELQCPDCAACLLADSGCDASVAADSEQAQEEKSTGHFDCRKGYKDRDSKWSADKKMWCCQNERLGCAEAALLPANATGGSGHSSVAESADTAAEDSVVAVGCQATCTLDGQSATCAERVTWSAAHTFAGSEGACQRALDVVLQDCDMCAGCSIDEVDCPSAEAAALAQAAGCQESCVFKGEAGLCSQRIRWASENVFAGQPDACRLAHNLTLSQCDVCASCSPAQAGCAAGEPSRSSDSSAGGTSTTPTVQAQIEKYDCSEDYFDWIRLWNPEKKSWCCKAKGRGCPGSTTAKYPRLRPTPARPATSSTTAASTTAKPSTRSTTSAGQHRRSTTSAGQQPMLFNCSAGFARRREGWSEAKLRWCCEKQSVGCAADVEEGIIYRNFIEVSTVIRAKLLGQRRQAAAVAFAAGFVVVFVGFIGGLAYCAQARLRPPAQQMQRLLPDEPIEPRPMEGAAPGASDLAAHVDSDAPLQSSAAELRAQGWRSRLQSRG